MANSYLVNFRPHFKKDYGTNDTMLVPTMEFFVPAGSQVNPIDPPASINGDVVLKFELLIPNMLEEVQIVNMIYEVPVPCQSPWTGTLPHWTSVVIGFLNPDGLAGYDKDTMITVGEPPK